MTTDTALAALRDAVRAELLRELQDWRGGLDTDDLDPHYLDGVDDAIIVLTA